MDMELTYHEITKQLALTHSALLCEALEAVEVMKKRSAALQQEEIATMAQMEEHLGETMEVAKWTNEQRMRVVFAIFDAFFKIIVL